MAKGTRSSQRTHPYNSLRTIKQLMVAGMVELGDEAVSGASKFFGWTVADIRSAILKLQLKHYSHTVDHRCRPPELNIKIDHYRARGLMGENVYIHLHVENGTLKIDSFKEI